MEFAEWVVSGLDQLRAGRLPAGQSLRQAVAAGLGDSTTLDAYLDGGDDAARAALVQAIAQAAAENPAFEQQVRQAAESAQYTGAEGTGAAGGAAAAEGSGAPEATAVAGGTVAPEGSAVAGGTVALEGAAAADAKPPFFKTTNGLLVLVAAAVVVVGGGVGLGVGLSGDSGGGGLAGVLKGTWSCKGFEGTSGSITLGDGVWTSGGSKGAWRQEGSKVSISDSAEPDGGEIVITPVPSGAGSIDATMSSTKSSDPANTLKVKGTVSAHNLALSIQPAGSPAGLNITCTK
ncbi:MAG: hypothetical protein HOW97_09295 [Catenulispora sp.]|nr:hypothetical protein [Catenulispora sp.]